MTNGPSATIGEILTVTCHACAIASPWPTILSTTAAAQ
jgi:hypothetical protein